MRRIWVTLGVVRSSLIGSIGPPPPPGIAGPLRTRRGGGREPSGGDRAPVLGPMCPLVCGTLIPQRRGSSRFQGNLERGMRGSVGPEQVRSTMPLILEGREEGPVSGSPPSWSSLSHSWGRPSAAVRPSAP
uniref:Uncharacterized protein n=1 Tax=Pipistrellus kuhlii TaxID=59472 RepID=A0A7J7V0S8_PIPKU|nr:hypothetical protein mPipKuh1_008660 [Pipistrellus kuhlii]